MNPKDVVRDGYDALSYLYRGDTDEPAQYGPWIDGIRERVPAGGAVLDIGCGCGVPIARALAAIGFAVTGIDISGVQIERARRLVPAATFHQGDAVELDFAPGSFDAVVTTYALIHMPHADQRRLVNAIGSWLRPGGWLLATVGASAWTGTEQRWLGGDAAMWWSHPDAATYRGWFAAAGLRVVEESYVPEGGGGHQVFWATR